MPTFPNVFSAPDELLEDDAACGPLAVWQVLTHFGIVTSSDAIVTACRYDTEGGSHTVGLAVALARHGCTVSFYSEHDPSPEPVEIISYRELASLGIDATVPPDLATLLSGLDSEHVGVLLYQSRADSDFGHFTPILGVDERGVIAPNESEEFSISQLDELWRVPGLFRQAIVASRAPAAQRALHSLAIQ